MAGLCRPSIDSNGVPRPDTQRSSGSNYTRKAVVNFPVLGRAGFALCGALASTHQAAAAL